MSMTDPIADLLTRIRNAAQARKETVDIPMSTVKTHILDVLVAEGFVREYSTVTSPEGHRMLRVALKYDPRNQSVINGMRRVSKPSLRVYVGAKEIPVLRSGLGVNIVSTPAGIMTDREARQRNLGGELMCAVW